MDIARFPLATLVVFFYKQEQFVHDTVAGALSQTYPNLEIVFSDDNSPDNTFAEIQKAVKDYRGPHRIILNRNEKNMGIVPHINKLLFELSHGDFVFINGGDDVSMPERVAWSVDYFLSNPSTMSVTGSYITIDRNGNETGSIIAGNDVFLRVEDRDYLSSDSFMTGGVALSFRRQVLDVFGKLENDCQTEDSVLRFRSILLGPALMSSKVFLKYRIHENNISRNICNFKTDKIAFQYLTDLNAVKESLSPQLYRALTRKIRHYTTIRSLQERESQSSSPVRYLYMIARRCRRFFYIRSFLNNA